MLMAVNEPYALMVQPDDILISPREVDEHFGTMVCFHPRYALGDHHNYMDKDDFLREMYLDTVGHDEAGMKRYERMVNIVSSRFRHGPKTEERAIDEAMQKVISEKYLMLPLYLYDHSGLAMSTESFSGRAPHAEWDSGQVGWIYVSKEDALKEFDADKMTGAIRQKADALMRSEVAAYDSYLRGECYGFELYKNGELSDSCWGFMGNFSDVLKDMAAYLPDECKGMVDHLEEQERPATIIKTLLKHAKIQVDQAAKAFEHASRQQVLVDMKGVFLCLKYELLQMQKQGFGAIVNTASIGGYKMAPGFAAYGPAKAAVIALTEMAALENAAFGIRVNAICPGPTMGTELTKNSLSTNSHEEEMLKEHVIPMKKLATTQEVVNAVLRAGRIWRRSLMSIVTAL